MRPAELDAVPADIWSRLAAGAGAWRRPVLASVASGGIGDARVVVLRETDVERRRLVFFTDRRSRKMAQLSANPQVCLLVFDEALRRQVRLYGEADEIESAKRLDDWWSSLAGFQRSHYAADVAASVSLQEKGRENFAAFEIEVRRFHCLWLDDDGNTAADFEWRDDRWRGHPVRP